MKKKKLFRSVAAVAVTFAITMGVLYADIPVKMPACGVPCESKSDESDCQDCCQLDCVPVGGNTKDRSNCYSWCSQNKN